MLLMECAAGTVISSFHLFEQFVHGYGVQTVIHPHGFVSIVGEYGGTAFGRSVQESPQTGQIAMAPARCHLSSTPSSTGLKMLSMSLDP
jgi:hypothetical protein